MVDDCQLTAVLAPAIDLVRCCCYHVAALFDRRPDALLRGLGPFLFARLPCVEGVSEALTQQCVGASAITVSPSPRCTLIAPGWAWHWAGHGIRCRQMPAHLARLHRSWTRRPKSGASTSLMGRNQATQLTNTKESNMGILGRGPDDPSSAANIALTRLI